MQLASLLSEDQILSRLTATDHWGAIVELVDHLVRIGRFTSDARDPILEGLRARESAMSTGIGYGVAIPHTASPYVTEVIAAFGRAPEGIPFDSLDNKPVRFVVLFVVPTDQFQLHLRTLAAIARFLNEPGIGDRLAFAADAREIYSIFRAACVRGR